MFHIRDGCDFGLKIQKVIQLPLLINLFLTVLNIVPYGEKYAIAFFSFLLSAINLIFASIT